MELVHRLKIHLKDFKQHLEMNWIEN